MGRRIVILILCLALAGCGAQQDAVQEAMDFRVKLLEAPDCTFSADVAADYGERVCRFSLDCAYDAQAGRSTLTVTAPEAIAGISAAVEGRDAAIAFEDTRLELGTLPGGRAAPLQLPWLLGDAWAHGYLESQSKLSDGWLATYRIGYGDDELVISTWFDERMTPTEAEIYSGSERVLSAELSGFTIK